MQHRLPESPPYGQQRIIRNIGLVIVIARGNHLQHFINGVKMSEVYDEQSDAAASAGILALQLHAGPPMTVQFKNLRIKELK